MSGVPRSSVAGCLKRAAKTVAMRAPARRARQRYSTSSPQMKNSSRTRPIRSTRSRVSSTPLNGITTPATSPSTAAASTSAILCTTRDRPGSRIGKQSRDSSCSATTAGPTKSWSAMCGSRSPRQSDAGVPSSSIIQTRSAPRSSAAASPAWNPPAPPVLRPSSTTVTGTGDPSARSTSTVSSVEALSTTRISSGSTVPRPVSVTSRVTRSRRLKVTATATIRGVVRGASGTR